MEDVSFDELDDLSSASEQLDSEEFGDISELLEDFERNRDDTRTKSEDRKISTEQRKTKDVNSRIQIVKERLIMNDEKKAEKASVVCTSNIPVRMTNSANASERSNKEGAKRTEEKRDIGTNSSGLDGKDMKNNRLSMNPKVIVHLGLEEHAEVENGGKNDRESFEEDKSVSAKELDLRPPAESLRRSKDNATSKEEERKCQQAPGDVKEREIRTRSPNQTDLKSLPDIVLNSEENKQKEEQNKDIVTVINGGAVVMEKEVMNEADIDQDVKDNNLNGQEHVIRGKHFDSDIVIPSQPVDSEVSNEKPLNNDNDNGTKDDLRIDSAVKCTSQSIDYSTSCHNGKANKDQAKSKNNEGHDLNLGDGCDECRCHEDVTTPSLTLNALDSSDYHDKLNYDDNGKMKAMNLGEDRLQGRATLATAVPCHSDNEERYKIRGFGASFSTNEEKTVEHNWRKSDVVQEMKDHYKGVGIPSEVVDKELEIQEQEKSELNDFKVHQVHHENDKLVSFSVDGEEKNEKLCYGKTKMKELDSDEADIINKTSCYKDEEIHSITIHENRRNWRSNDKNCKEIECVASELNEALSLSEDGERVLINCDTPNKNEEKTKKIDSNDKEGIKDDIINTAGCVDKLNECEQGVKNKVQKSFRDSVRREDDPHSLIADDITQQNKQEGKSQTNEEDEEKLKRRERGTHECYDSENYLLPQDVTAFDPPFCSTPRYGEVPTVNASHAILDGTMEAFEGFRSEYQPDQNSKLELGGLENGSAGCGDSEDAATGSKTANRKNIQPRYCTIKEDISPFTTRPTQNRRVFKEDMAKDIGFEDVESIYAASLDGDLEHFSLENVREMKMMSPENEELDACLQDVATVRTIDDSSDHNRTSVSNGIRQPPHRKYYKTRPKRHQESFIKMPSGLNLDEKSSLSYDPDHLQLPCAIDTQRTAQPNDRRLLPDKPMQRKSAFVPVGSRSVRKNDYYRKRTVDANSWQGPLRESGPDRGCADHCNFQNQDDNFQGNTNKYYDKYFHSTNALNKFQTTINDNNSSPTTTRHNKNHLMSEPSWNERYPGHQDFHVEYSNSKHESNLSCTSQIGTLHVITFPLSHGPGIVIGGGSTNKTPGIYVKEVIEGGDAFQDGRLRPGDKLLTVNGYNFSIASLSQAKSVLRKLKHASSEKIANIRFFRDSDNVAVDDVDSIDQSVTLPFSFSETSCCEEIGAKEVRYSARYLKEDLTLPTATPLMTSTPVGVDVVLRGKNNSQDSGYEHPPSSGKLSHVNEGLLMIAPNTKVHLSQLESSLSFLGLELSPHQKYLLRNQVVVDSEGYVIYEDFVKVARSIYGLDLSRTQWDYTCYPEQGLHSSTSLISPLPDIIPGPSANGILALRREFDQLVTEKDQIKDEILDIKKRLNGKAKMLRRMENELVEVRNNLKRVENRKVLLLKEEKELKKAPLSNSSKVQDYKTVISSLEHEIVKLKALKLPVTSQLVTRHALLSKQIEMLVTRVRNAERSNQNYQNVTQKLMDFVHKVHTILHDDQLDDRTSSKDHTYQSVDRIPVPKSKEFKKGDRRVENLKQFFSREAQRVISTVQSMLSHVPLPFGWDEAYTEKGQIFYIDHLSEVTTRRPPS